MSNIAQFSSVRQRKTLESWLRDALTDADKDAPCTLLSLVHVQGQHQKELHSKKVSPGMPLPELAGLFRGKADAYAQDLPGLQTFAILAFYGKSEPEASLPFTVQGDYGLDPVAGTFAPTPTGEKQMGMQFAQAALAMAFGQTRMLLEAQNTLVATLGNRLDKAMDENHDAIDIVRELILSKAADTHQHQMDQLKFERRTTLLNKLVESVPLAVNTITGREVFPQTSTDTALIEQIADAFAEMPDEAIGKLAAIMPPQLMAPLAQRMTEHLDKKRREKEAVREASQTMVPRPQDPPTDA